MKRKHKKIATLSIVALAIYGAVCLWSACKAEVNQGVDRVENAWESLVD